MNNDTKLCGLSQTGSLCGEKLSTIAVVMAKLAIRQ
jgi:hypothetical protein